MVISNTSYISSSSVVGNYPFAIGPPLLPLAAFYTESTPPASTIPPTVSASSVVSVLISTSYPSTRCLAIVPNTSSSLVLIRSAVLTYPPYAIALICSSVVSPTWSSLGCIANVGTISSVLYEFPPSTSMGVIRWGS